MSFTAQFKPHRGLVKPRSRRLGGFLLCLRFIYLFFNRAAAGVRGSSFPRCCFFFFLTAQPQACAGLVLHGFFFLTAQPQACAGLVLHGVFFFFLVLSVTWPRPTLGQMLVRIINHETCNV